MNGSSNRKAVKIALFSGFAKELTYLVPENMKNVQVGSMVKVPLRTGASQGVVLSVFDADELPKENFKYKKIYSKVQEEPVLTPDLIELAYWIRDYYGCSLQSVFETMIPAGVRAGKVALEVQEVVLRKILEEDELQKLKKK